ncbi:hypothetical protein GCM10009602_16950 [Nocardiopsis tropica]
MDHAEQSAFPGARGVVAGPGGTGQSRGLLVVPEVHRLMREGAQDVADVRPVTGRRPYARPGAAQ